MQEQITQIIGYLHGMWRYRWSALLIGWFVAIVGWLAVFNLPDQYQAHAVVYMDTSSVLKPLLEGLAVETNDAEEIDIISRYLLSRENLLSVIRETDADLQAKTQKEKERLVTSLAKDIKLEESGSRDLRRDQTKHIYEISYKSDSAQHVYKVVSILLSSTIEKMLSYGRTDTAIAQQFLSKQIEEYEKRLVLAEQRLAAFKKENIGMMPDATGGYYERLQAAQDQVDQISGELRLARQRHGELLKQLKGEKPLLQSQVSDTRLQGYREQLDALLRRYTENHPDVKALRELIRTYEEDKQSANQQLASSDTALNIEFNPVYQDLKIEISRASVDVEALKLQLSEQQQRVQKLKDLIDAIPGVEAKLAELNRDYEVSQQRYIELVDRRESARLAELAGQSSGEIKVRVIEPPIIPTQPIGPNRPLLIIGVLIGAFGVGLGWCVLRYILKPTVTNVKQLRNETELPVFGAVSLFLTPQHKGKRMVQLSLFMSVVFFLAIVAGGLVWKQEIGVKKLRDFKENHNADSLRNLIKDFSVD